MEKSEHPIITKEAVCRTGNFCNQAMSQVCAVCSLFLSVDECYGDFTSTISPQDAWLMMSAMKLRQVTPTLRPYGRLKLVGAGLALAVVGKYAAAQGR